MQPDETADTWTSLFDCIFKITAFQMRKVKHDLDEVIDRLITQYY